MHGDNHAKRIVIDEAEGLAKSLQNGSAGDPKTQGRAIALIVKMITPLYQARFITMEECLERHGEFKKIQAKLDRQDTTSSHKTRIKIGPIELEGKFSPLFIVTAIPCLANLLFIYYIGKTHQWW